ncbi:MAG: 2-dehydropantoate 2-reductase [Anaerolineae bacterium]|nr:2-dehydropantoate 2-reductase [Caldilineales bacterium]MCX7853365.1 2-dehydropantoate 2-reductase [Caldilineales bacterium]MDW8269309.1 2-dehydropantoate 2-reductase [Anaerolineae bacterium]
MKIVIMGAGALGSVFGGYLARAGFDVTLIGREAHIRAIQANGLRVTGEHEFVVPVRATTDAKTVAEADVLLFCVRAPEVPQALTDVAHLQPEIVASFQNGLRKDEPLIAHFGPGPVVGATTILAARRLEPGHVRCTAMGYTWFGELDNRQTPRLQAVVQAWRKAGLPVEVPADIHVVEWAKLAYLLPVSVLSGLTRLPYHQILQSSDLAYVFVQLAREVHKIARAYNVMIGDYPGLGLRSLLHAPFDEAIQVLATRGRTLEAAGQTDITTNMLDDLQLRRQTEIEAIAGDLVRMAHDAGLATPAVEMVYRVIRGMDFWARR